MPPKMTGMPLWRKWSAISQPRGACEVSIIEMQTRSTLSFRSTGSTFSSVNLRSCSSGIVAAKQTGPCGGR